MLLVPLLLLLALLSYLWACSLYPGGSRFDPSAEGHQFLHNYLCDLFNAHPHGHRANPARPFGIAALVFLSLTLLPVSWTIGVLFRPAGAARRLVPGLGTVGGVCGCLVFTALHDWAIVLGFFPTAVAFSLSLFALFENGYVRLARLGLLPLLLGGLNFTLWALELGVPFIPVVQKLAITSLMVWLSVVACVIRATADPPDPAQRPDT